MSLTGLAAKIAHLSSLKHTRPCERCGLHYAPQEGEPCPHCGGLNESALAALKAELRREEAGGRALGIGFALMAIAILVLLLIIWRLV